MEKGFIKMINILEVKRRLNLDRPDIANMHDSHLITGKVGDIRMAWGLIMQLSLENAQLKDNIARMKQSVE